MATGEGQVLGEAMRERRTRLGLSQDDLARAAGVDAKTIRNIEAGRNRPRPSTLRLLADALGVQGSDRDRLFAAAGSAPVRPAGQQPVPTPAQLPTDLRFFAGRDAQMASLDAALDGVFGSAADSDDTAAVLILAISGTAGVGKTALAVHWAHQVRHKFPDGQLYLNLRGFDPGATMLDPATAIRAFLDALGIGVQRVPATLDAQAGLYRSLLANRRMLIVLDNARHADQVRPLLPGSARCLVMVTSRNELAGLVAVEGARPIMLDLPSTADARHMLTRRLGQHRVSAEPEAVEEIIQRCARLPLALAIVAARAMARPGFALATLAAQLDNNSGAGLGPWSDVDAAVDVRAVFSWSYRVLDTTAARLFRLLGLHTAPDITAAAAASLAGLPAEHTRALLVELTRAHLLIEAAPGRYVFHDLLRAYAIELTETEDSDAEREKAVHRMLDHYLHVAHTAAALLEPNREQITIEAPVEGVATVTLTTFGQAEEWLTAEHRVLVHLIGLAAGRGFGTHAWQLAWTLATYFQRRGHWHDQAATLQIALETARRHGASLGQAYSLLGLARAYFRMGRYDDAHDGLREALDLFIKCDHDLGQARVHGAIGFFHTSRGRYREALQHLQISHDLFRACGQRHGTGELLNDLGWNHAMLGDYSQALTFCLQALDLQQEVDDRHGQANTWDSLGYVHHHLGHQQEAVECYRAALRLFQEVNERYLEAKTLIHLGDHYRAAADPDATRLIWSEALEILDELKHPDADQVRAKLQLLNGFLLVQAGVEVDVVPAVGVAHGAAKRALQAERSLGGNAARGRVGSGVLQEQAVEPQGVEGPCG